MATDANGNQTKFKQDIQMRTTEKKYANGNTETCEYETGSNRPAKITDAKSQVKNFKYYKDDNLQSVTYTSTSGQPLNPPTPTVTFAYDSIYNRRSSMADGTGTTTYNYYPVPQLGATQAKDIDGPLPNDTITYSYDQLGRQTGRSINGVSETTTFDAKDRVTQIVNPLGTFIYAYAGSSSRLTGITYPAASTLSTALTYLGNTGDKRPQDITHTLGANTLMKFGYAYNAQGNITQWKQQSGVGAVMERWDLGYDSVDQLISGFRKIDSTNALLEQNANLYDELGNRLTKQVDGTILGATFNNVNQLTTMQAGGKMSFEGTVNEPSQVMIGGVNAPVDGSNTFHGEANVVVGTNNIPIVATDARGNSTSKTAVVVVPSATTKTLSYDNNGNLTNDGERTYEWDAENRLVAINYTGNTKRSEFSYDGMNRRVRIVEKTGNTTTSDIRHLYDGPEIAEERDSIVATVQKQYFAQGFKAGMAKYYYAKDHLGSIVELVDDSGVVRGQWTYDLWGKRSANQITTNPINSDFGYTGHFQHGESGLIATMYRFYDPVTARWLSQDWIGEAGGMNLYGYVSNNPTNLVDLLGLDSMNLINPNDARRQGGMTKDFVDHAPLDPNAYTVAAHGNAQGIEDSNGKLLSASELANLIKADPHYDPCKPVKLNACKTGGNTADGSSNFAQQLADALGNTVIAPTDDLHRWADAKPFASIWENPYNYHSEVRNGGGFVPFSPK